MGVKINDQMAHYQKVLEEVRIANDELSKTFAQTAKAKAEAEYSLGKIQAAIELAQEYHLMIVSDCKKRDENSRMTAISALKDQLEAANALNHAHDEAAKIVTEAQKKVADLTVEIERLEGFLTSYEQRAATLTAEVGSLENDREYLGTTLKSLRALVSDETTLHTETTQKHKAEINALLKEKAEAEAELAQAREATKATFENLDKREKAVASKEIDNTILQQRLHALITKELKS